MSASDDQFAAIQKRLQSEFEFDAENAQKVALDAVADGLRAEHLTLDIVGALIRNRLEKFLQRAQSNHWPLSARTLRAIDDTERVIALVDSRKGPAS